MKCCCVYGAAVAGEWPEFDCNECERHGGAFGTSNHRCKFHRRQHAISEGN
jgi:hypothetical protein